MGKLLLGHLEFIVFDQGKAVGFPFLFGVDEAGRGPLAGPVVAAAVWLKDTGFTCRIGDSKALHARQRDTAFAEIHARGLVGVGIVSETVIDTINILCATHQAMTRAVHALAAQMPCPPDAVKVIIDGNAYRGDIPFAHECVVKGDAQSLAIACASIVAKVTRDRIMDDYDRLYPAYGFKAHKGYPTQAHRDAVKAFGFSPIHRKTFRVR